MKAFVNRAKAFLKSEDGPTATEYAVMVALIAVVVIAGATTLGNAISQEFSDVSTHIDNA